MVYIHIHGRLVSHKKQTHVGRVWNDRWKIKIDKILKSFMPCNDRVKYSKQLKDYLHPPPPCLKAHKPHVDRKDGTYLKRTHICWLRITRSLAALKSMSVLWNWLQEKENSQKEIRNQLSKAYSIVDLESRSCSTKKEKWQRYSWEN